MAQSAAESRAHRSPTSAFTSAHAPAPRLSTTHSTALSRTSHGSVPHTASHCSSTWGGRLEREKKGRL
eukprot:1469859-Rhodomonas_salina.1